MSGIRFVKAAERSFEHLGGPPGSVKVGRDVTVNESKSFGASVFTFEDCDIEWTVLYDEYIYVLEGQLDLETKEGTFHIAPGDGIWLPNGTWMVYRAKFAKALVIVHPVNWRELQGH